MQQSKNKSKPIEIFVTIVLYFSFSLAYWYVSRAMVLSFSDNPIVANEISAAILGGLIAFAVFMFMLRYLGRGLEKLKIEDLDKKLLRLKLFFVAANIVSFLLSFLYFALPFLIVWGEVLLNFFIQLIFIVVYLILESKKFKDKTKIANFVLQIGVTFLIFYGVVLLIGLFFGF